MRRLLGRRRVAEVDTVDFEETGQKPAKECAGARVLNPEVEAEKQAGRHAVERARDRGCRVRPVPVKPKRGCVERSDGGAVRSCFPDESAVVRIRRNVDGADGGEHRQRATSWTRPMSTWHDAYRRVSLRVGTLNAR